MNSQKLAFCITLLALGMGLIGAGCRGDDVEAPVVTRQAMSTSANWGTGLARCGDHKVDCRTDDYGETLCEACDDGNQRAGDGCSVTCTIEPGWVCSNACKSWRCGIPQGECHRPRCGDGIPDFWLNEDGIEVVEECDDHNQRAGDGCSTDCTVEPGWTCDFPRRPCRRLVCGDGRVDAYTDLNGITYNESCDDGNRRNGDGCDRTCSVEPGWRCDMPGQPCGRMCGNGLVESYTDQNGNIHEENCEDGNVLGSDGCSADCTIEPGWRCENLGQPCVQLVCGDGRTDSYMAPSGAPHQETCDDGNVQNGDGCSNTCSIEWGWYCDAPGQPCRQASCGDGLADTYVDMSGVSRVETCDDGNQVDNDACRNDCTLSRCGDSVIWTGVETCDDGNALAGDGCSTSCTVEGGWLCEKSGQPCVHQCGNGQVESYPDGLGGTYVETCDDGNAQDNFSPCSVVCTDSCFVSNSDGCSASCQVQTGWVCQTPGQACCSNKCIKGDTQCSDAGVQECAIQANGCTDWNPSLACPDNSRCIGADCRTGNVETGLTITGDTSKTLDGNHVYDGDVIIQNSSVLTVPTGKLIIRAKRVVLDASSTIIVRPTGHDPRGTNGSGGYGTPGGPTGSVQGSVMSCLNCSYTLDCIYAAQFDSSRSCETYRCASWSLGGSPYAIADDEIASGARGTTAADLSGCSVAGVANGGGYIAILADVIQINGTVSVNGAQSGSGGLVFLRATGDLTFSGKVSTAGGGGDGQHYPLGDTQPMGSCTIVKHGGDGVVKLLHGSQSAVSVSGVSGGVIFSSVMPPADLLSLTHPQQNRWYNDDFDYVDVAWSKPFTDAAGYYTRANTTYGFVPGPSNADYKTSESARLLRNDFKSGTNYVHVTTVDASDEVGTVESRLVININTSTPSISSTTHPSQTTWYSASAPSLSWSLPNSAADTSNLYWVLDQYSETVPTVNDNKIPVDPTAPSAFTSIQLPTMANGIWFFHLRAQDTMGYLTKATAHYRMQIGPDPGTGTVAGTVTDSATGTPLAAAEISLNRGLHTTLSNRSGQFAFNANVYAQQYEVRARLAGYQATSQAISVAANQTTAVSFALQCLDAAVCSAGQQELTPVAVAAGSSHTCAALAGGAVVCWGSNSNGQLGDGTTTDSSTPVFVAGLSNATAIATGYSHTCAVLAGGTVQCWGDNRSGQFGNGTTTDSSTPVLVIGLSGATAIAAGGYQSFLTKRVESHTCALLTSGSVMCWGSTSPGEPGPGTVTSSLTPVLVSGLSNATAIAAGPEHTCALLAGGTVQCWGDNSGSQFGIETTSGATAIAAGYPHTCALLAGGAVECWPAVPPYLSVLSGVSGATAIGAGGIGGLPTICVILTGGTVECWGYDPSGSPPFDLSTPNVFVSLSGATAIALGGRHTCALLTDGTLKCWGYNPSGQLGNGTTTDAPTPVAVAW